MSNVNNDNKQATERKETHMIKLGVSNDLAPNHKHAFDSTDTFEKTSESKQEKEEKSKEKETAEDKE